MAGQKTRRGRPPGPSALTPEVGRQLQALVRAGLSLEVAATMAGVSARSVRRWRSCGAIDLDASLAEAELTLLFAVRRSRSWKAAAWLLETQFPERWSLRH